MEDRSTRKSRGTGQKVALTMVILALVGAVAGYGTWSAFSDTTDNSGNSFAAGTVTIGDNDADSAMLTLSNAQPGDFDEGCIQVSYTGSLPATVRMYGTTAGSGLDQYLDVTVTRGSVSGSFDDCTGFTPDSTTYGYPGTGVVYEGTLQGYPDGYAGGIVDPMSGSPESWTNPETHAYKIRVTVQDNNSAQGLNATQEFTWEARNS